MKKTTFLLLFLIAWIGESYAQCINTVPFPSDPVPAVSFGEVQEIATCTFTKEYSTISGILIGADYIFTCVDGSLTNKYITVTDLTNNVIAHGASPLTVEAISTSGVRLHYTEDAACAIQEVCHVTTLQAVLTCPVPVNIAVTGITTTNADFSWEAGDAETEWQVIVIGEGDAEPGVATVGTTVTEPEFSVSNLTAGNLYRFYIRAKCGTEFSPWRGPKIFASACLPTGLFSQNFDTAEVGELPICWSALYIDASEDASIETVDFKSYSGANAVQISNAETGEASNLLLVSPPLSTLTTGTHRLKFFASGYGNVDVEVGTVSSVGDDAVFTMVQTVSATSDYAEFVVDFTGYDGTDTYVAFRHPSTSTYNPIFLDDIRWEVAPLCPDVSGIIVDALTTASATISWTAGGNETAWNVVYGPTSAEDPDGLTPLSPASTNTTATIPGLAPNTDYKVWVRSSCGGTAGDGAWIGPVTFTTSCLATGLFNENFDTTDQSDLPECWSAVITGASNNAYIYVTEGDGLTGSNAVTLYNADSAEDAAIILVSPNVNTLAAATHRLKFWARAQGQASIEIGSIDTPAAGGTFAPYDTIELTGTYQEYVVDFTANPVTDTYVAIKHIGEMYSGIIIDNIRWELAPLCADVTAVAPGAVTPSSIALTWTANAAETQWDVVYGAETVTDPGTLTPISPSPSINPEATISGLTDNTTYNIWVRSVCGGTQGIGAWIGPLKVKTACLPTGVFNEGFETTDYGDLPDCWSKLIYGSTVSEYAAVRTVDFQAATGDNSVELWTDDSAEDDFVMLVSPYLNTLSTATHRLKFSATSYDPTSLQIGTLSGISAEAEFTPFEDVSVSDDNGNFTVDFTSYTGTDSYIAFRNISGAYKSIFIDDIRWEVSPLCDDVEEIITSNITINSALIEWSAGSVNNWQVAYGPASVTDPATLTPSAVLTLSEFPITGLQANESYNVWVRSVCGANGNGAWIGPINLKTLCLPVAVPYLEDFEGVTIPSVPACGVIQNVGNGNDWMTEENPGYGFESNTLVYSYDTNNDADAWYYTQGLQLTAGVEYSISYKYGNNSEDSYVESLRVMYGTSPDSQFMTEEIADHPEIDTGMASVNQVAFTPAATGVYYFGFHAYSIANQYDLYLDDIAITATLGSDDQRFATFSYYPNPVKDRLTVSYTNTITNIAVYNLLGQKVLENNMSSNTATVDMSVLPSGNYIVKVAAGQVTKTMKIIKE